MYNKLKINLHDVISGKSKVRFGTTIQAIANYLSEGTIPSTKIENSKLYKQQETKRLELLISKNNLWVSNIDFSQYVSEGAEQKVFLKNSQQVIKLNDGIYYDCWRDYLYNLLLHNFFFEDTSYELIGFTKENEVLFAVVQQAFVSITENTKIENVKSFLIENGFQNTRNNDYFNPNLGIILEDLHDENVLTKNEVLYFIDTVFYLTENFWIKS
jgi:hypothetical protein